MKTKNYFGLTSKLLATLFAITIFLSACKKDWNNDPIEAAAIGYIHASPGTGPLDLVFDSQKIGAATYTKDVGYFTVYPGTHLVGVAKKDSLKYLASGTALLRSGGFYSVFVVDTLKSTKLLLVEDDLKAPETDKAKIRFINLSPGATTFDLGVQGNATSVFTGKAFKEYTPFTNITPGESYIFELRQGTTVKATLPAVKIEKGKIYTFWAKGLSSATDSTKLALGVMTNK